jgi:hypothetical protein
MTMWLVGLMKDGDDACWISLLFPRLSLGYRELACDLGVH